MNYITNDDIKNNILNHIYDELKSDKYDNFKNIPFLKNILDIKFNFSYNVNHINDDIFMHEVSSNIIDNIINYSINYVLKNSKIKNTNIIKNDSIFEYLEDLFYNYNINHNNNKHDFVYSPFNKPFFYYGYSLKEYFLKNYNLKYGFHIQNKQYRPELNTTLLSKNSYPILLNNLKNNLFLTKYPIIDLNKMQITIEIREYNKFEKIITVLCRMPIYNEIEHNIYYTSKDIDIKNFYRLKKIKRILKR